MANRKKPLVVVTRKLPDSVETRMRELFDAQLNLADKPMTPSELAETVRAADVLVPTVTDRIDAAVLSKAGEKLKLIANYGNGVDHIDVATGIRLDPPPTDVELFADVHREPPKAGRCALDPKLPRRCLYVSIYTSHS